MHCELCGIMLGTHWRRGQHGRLAHLLLISFIGMNHFAEINQRTQTSQWQEVAIGGSDTAEQKRTRHEANSFKNFWDFAVLRHYFFFFCSFSLYILISTWLSSSLHMSQYNAIRLTPVNTKFSGTREISSENELWIYKKGVTMALFYLQDEIGTTGLHKKKSATLVCIFFWNRIIESKLQRCVDSFSALPLPPRRRSMGTRAAFVSEVLGCGS